MSINSYFYGAKVRVSVAFVDDVSAPVNPSTVQLTVIAPKLVGGTPPGEERVYTYGADPAVVRDSTGNYHADITTDANGVWRWRWSGTGGTAQAAYEGSFIVKSNVIKP